MSFIIRYRYVYILRLFYFDVFKSSQNWQMSCLNFNNSLLIIKIQYVVESTIIHSTINSLFSRYVHLKYFLFATYETSKMWREQYSHPKSCRRAHACNKGSLLALTRYNIHPTCRLGWMHACIQFLAPSTGKMWNNTYAHALTTVRPFLYSPFARALIDGWNFYLIESNIYAQLAS
jgi:hypothetical protein